MIPSADDKPSSDRVELPTAVLAHAAFFAMEGQRAASLVVDLAVL
jgi:hypothetical protein